MDHAGDQRDRLIGFIPKSIFGDLEYTNDIGEGVVDQGGSHGAAQNDHQGWIVDEPCS